MTVKEQQTIDKLVTLMQTIRTENTQFRNDIKLQVETMNKKVEAKHAPIQLEKDILSSAQRAVHDSISKVLTDYNSPLKPLILEVVNKNTPYLRDLISECFDVAIKPEEFKQSIIKAFSHKLARSVISNNEGLFDKVHNELKQSPVFKSKATIAISNVIEECLIENRTK